MPHSNKQMISLFLTTKCNLRCVYCYNEKERTKANEISLPFEIAKAGIDDYFANNDSRHIRFYGPGEPTQEFELMCEIVEYAKRKDITVTTELQTNGAFSPKIRKWILNNINIVWISFDGEPEIQNKQRPFPKGKESAPTIEKNIKWMVENRTDQNFMVGARVTMTDENVNRQIGMIDYFNSLGIQYIWTDPIFPEVKECAVCFDKNREEKYHIDLDTYVEKYIEAYVYAKENNIFYGSFLTCNFDGKARTHCRACTPVPHLTPDGYVSACDLVVFGEKAHHMDCFIYGKWDGELEKFIYFDDKIKSLRERTIDNIQHCKSCKVKLHCGGHCLGEVVNETGKLDGQKPYTCKAIRKLFDALGICDEYDYMHP